MAIDLGSLIGAVTKGAGGYLRGANEGEAERYRRDERAQQQRREEERATTEAALRRWALEQQAEREKRIATPTPKWQDDGYGSFEDWRKDNAPDTRPEWQKKGYTSFEEWRRDRVSGRGVSRGTAGRSTEAEEAEGLAIINSPPKSREVNAAFRQAYQAARARNPTMTPGRLAKQVMDGLRRARPDLFSAAGGGGLFDDMEAAPSAPTPTPTPTAGSPAGSPADRWEELVAQGMSPEEATQRVQQEMGG